MADRVQPWDEIFRREGRVFTEPHEEMPRLVRRLKTAGATRVLDLGSGSGRHLVYLAGQGFSVYGVDNSPEGIQASHAWLAEEGLEGSLQLHDFSDRLPFADGFFDAVVSVQAIHHAMLATIERIVREVTRVLKTGGLLLVTVPRQSNQGSAFEQIEENTFVPLDGREKGLPHHYFTPQTLREAFGDFEVQALEVDAAEHYCLWAVKRALGDSV